METQVSARGIEPTEEMRSAARAVAERLHAREPGITLAKYLFEGRGGRIAVAAVYAVEGYESVVVQREAGDWRVALQRLEEELQKVLEEEGAEADGQA